MKINLAEFFYVQIVFATTKYSLHTRPNDTIFDGRMPSSINISFLLLVPVCLFVSCAKIPETGFRGVILLGKGSCDVIFDQGYGRTYEKYDGLVYFVPYSVVQKIPVKSAEILISEGIKTTSNKGMVCAELNPGIYVVMLNDFYSPEAEKVIKISSGDLVQANVSFWICE